MCPPGNKLKQLINELYRKEKRYVRQYLREDFLANNSFIFDIGKSHKLELHSANPLPTQTRMQ